MNINYRKNFKDIKDMEKFEEYLNESLKCINLMISNQKDTLQRLEFSNLIVQIFK